MLSYKRIELDFQHLNFRNHFQLPRELKDSNW